MMGESISSKPNKGIGIPSPTPSTPAASSLYEIIRHHCRERLLVRPLLWTNLHLELLQISFDEPTLAPKTNRLDYFSKRSIKYPGIRVMRGYLQRYHLLEGREKFVRALFYGFDSPFTSDSKALFVNLQWYSAYAPCEGIELREAGSEWVDSKYPQYPICAYIDSGRIEEWRRGSLHLDLCSPHNAPVYAMLCQKLKKLRPSDPLKEPYIAALLIAEAQYRRLVAELENPDNLPPLEIYPTQVLYSLESQTSVYLYKADIPSLLLDMFEHPTIAPPRSPRISIQVLEISREPLDTFRDRILALVFPTTLDRPLGVEDGRKRKRN